MREQDLCTWRTDTAECKQARGDTGAVQYQRIRDRSRPISPKTKLSARISAAVEELADIERHRVEASSVLSTIRRADLTNTLIHDQRRELFSGSQHKRRGIHNPNAASSGGSSTA